MKETELPPNEPIELPPIEPVTLPPAGMIDPPSFRDPLPHSQALPSTKKKLAAKPVKQADAPTVFRCFNCVDDAGKIGRLFEADKPICPNCKVDGTQPRFQRFICPVERIHFDPPHPTIGEGGFNRIGANYLACNHAIKIPGPARASGEILAVNCPECLFSDEGQKALAGRPPADVPAEGNFKFRFSKPTEDK